VQFEPYCSCYCSCYCYERDTEAQARRRGRFGARASRGSEPDLQTQLVFEVL